MITRTYWESLVAPLGLSNSNAAVWKLLRDICITIAMSLDAIWQLFQTDVETALSSKQNK